MARMRKWVSAGIYQPNHQRHAYGRRPFSATLVEDAKGAAVTAREAPWWLTRRSVPMPCGGTRTLLRCPRCRRWATQLYNVDWLSPHTLGGGYACRVCLGLHYSSQYAGRRPEAAPDRMAQLAASAGMAKSVPTRARRKRRYQVVRETVSRRQERFEARRDTAKMLSLTILLVRAVNRENRQWARRILPAVLRADVVTRREVADSPDTPEWARAAILGSLGSTVRSDVPHTDAQEAPLGAPDEAPNQPKQDPEECDAPRLAALLSQERIDDLQATYAAWGAGRRQRKAA